MKNDYALWIGAGVLLGGLYFIAKGLSGNTQPLTVQYASQADEQNARMIKGALHPDEYVYGYVDPYGLEKPLLCVGAQMINPSYAVLVSLGVFPEVTESDAGYGYIYVRSFAGQPVYGVVGWNADDTRRAAEWIRDNKLLPTQDIVV